MKSARAPSRELEHETLNPGVRPPEAFYAALPLKKKEARLGGV